MRSGLWAHFCEVARELTWVGMREPCNWCDVRELRCDAVNEADFANAERPVRGNRQARPRHKPA
ncbi:hypothetical protein [Methylobacterium isbiliense]|jgi:hypothetical protein|uniref:Uncharacterized protein n=1 Tax=Methylobacterium isbiliense TaxID=315478 RepID=A0ABQ4SD53_9HYPH|nr:hypothetical protein [Methylobacterium isbiliense]GJD99615.1 hypothetical protein GMJLKIPL_1533 [Methylobacterium isbiliense]